MNGDESRPATPSPSALRIPELSAEALHLTALEAFRAGNRARLAFIRALRALAESRLFFSLGFPSIVAYSTRYFGYRRTETYEAVRVAGCLERLPRSLAAFSAGEVCWSALREITRVASPASEGTWLEFSTGRTVDEVRAEVEHAVASGSDRPRDHRFGLPDLKVRVVLEMTRTEHEVLRAALERFGAGAADRGDGSPVTPKEALLALAERVLASEPGDPLAGGLKEATGARVPRTLLYHVCPECRRGGMETAEGRVEISPEAIGQLEACSRRESIAVEEELAPASTPERAPTPARESARPDSRRVVDRPTPAGLRRRILLRDGRRCANPSCRRVAEHCHHIRYRSRGGRTAFRNETSVCGRCHALIHAGLLRVEGDPALGLRWRRVAVETSASGEGVG